MSATKKATPSPRKPRQARTPAQRAQERVDSLQRQYDRVVKKHSALEVEVRVLEDEGDALMRRLSYAKQDPDLAAAEQPTDDTAGGVQR